MKVGIVGASNFVNRMFEACGPFQWARETLKNALEANATKVTFGIEWQAVEKLGAYRRTIIDDGVGMNAEELHKFFSILGEGAKKIGGVHDNFGVGAKISLLPWNPNGVVVVSYKGGEASMIHIVLDRESGDYELMEFSDGAGKSCVIDPNEVEWGDGIDWSKLRPDWLKEHGTIIVLLGSDEYADTVLGNPLLGEGQIKGLSVYLNSRFWDLSTHKVTVVELRSPKKAQWPQSPDERDDARRPNNRAIEGARYYLEKVDAKNGRYLAGDTVLLDDERVSADWYLWDGERPHVDSYAKMNGYIAVRYNGELFHLTSHKMHFRWFGVLENKVQQNLTIILEPTHFKADGARWGVHPDQSRNRLIFTGGGRKGDDLPLGDWGAEFATDLPEEIMEAIRAARGDLSGSINDDEYRKRLQDKFGERWKMKALIDAAKTAAKSASKANLGDAEADVPLLPDLPGGSSSATSRGRRSRNVVRITKKKGSGAGGDAVVEVDVPVDVPRYRFGRKDDFEKPWHVASWAPNDMEGPTVVINIDSPIIDEAVQFHRAQYADVYAEEVTKTVQAVFGEVAVAKIAHSQKLAKEVSEEELDATYRNEASLTVALMGLLAEESLIAQRLGRLGKKQQKAS